MLVLFIHEPRCALWLAPSGALFPSVIRDSYSAALRQIGGWRRFGQLKRDGAIHHASHLRYDRHGPTVREGRDELGREYVALNPHLPFSLLWTANGSPDVERDMARLFTFRDDAEQAAADVVRMIERLSRDVALHREAGRKV
jgi:hypothetical protein